MRNSEREEEKIFTSVKYSYLYATFTENWKKQAVQNNSRTWTRKLKRRKSVICVNKYSESKRKNIVLATRVKLKLFVIYDRDRKLYFKEKGKEKD